VNQCPHCRTFLDVTPEHVYACAENAARSARVRALADQYGPYIPTAPVDGVQAFDLYAHLRSHPRSLTDAQAEAVAELVLHLGWRPYAPTPEPAPVMVGGTQTDALELLGGAT
jgi:hypothetical protein